MAKAKESPLRSGNPEGDTQRVDRSILLFNWQKREKTYTRDPETGNLTPGDYDTRKGNFKLLIPEATRDIFNITKFTEANETADEIETYNVRQYSYTRYKNIGSTGGAIVTVSAHQRKKGAKRSAMLLQKQHIVIPVIDKKTAKGNTRTVSFSFPAFWSVTMICQAVGTMLVNAPSDRKTGHFFMGSKRQPIPYGAPTGNPMTGFNMGAWLASSEITVSGGGRNITLVSSGGDTDGTTSGGTP